ncbi:MAG: hypothetical protein DRN49_00730 [Thaumarchaeota archaeon]|nr:MAG: hypothetical protein DRN49_00730 [Nitrososphaerota archaeon]
MIVRDVDSMKRSVVLIPESGLDLLNIFRLVKIGYEVYSETSREIKKERITGKVDSERVRVMLGIEVEGKTVDPLMRRISFAGRIIYESKPLDLLGKHHTIHLYPGMELRIKSQKEFERLKAFASSYASRERSERMLCISIDDERIAVAEFTGTGLNKLYSKSFPSINKSISWGEREIKRVFGEVLSILKDYFSKNKKSNVIIIGPKIFIEDFMNFLKNSEKSILKKVKKVYHSSVGGEDGIREAMRSGVLKDLADLLKPIRDSVEVERFIKQMSRNPEKVALGFREVLEAWKLGAVEKILISEDFLWNHIIDEDLGKLLEAAERGKLDLQVLLDGLEASEKIMGFGGVVAFLRYPLPLKDMIG